MAAYGEQYAFFDEAPYQQAETLSPAEEAFAAERAVEAASMEHYDAQRRLGQGVLELTSV